MKMVELMINDWVRMKIPSGTQWYTEKVRCLTPYDELEYQPIPLTEEILKANGFIHKDTMEEWWHEEYNPEWGIRMSDFELTDEFKFGRAKITYVHELQHALRLCGLNELADNLVVRL